MESRLVVIPKTLITLVYKTKSKGGTHLDRVTDWAFLLYRETSNEEVKQVAIKLLNGDLTVKELNNMDAIKIHFRTVKKKRRKGHIKSQEINKFIEEHIIFGNFKLK
jgi:hypothetical protein